MAQGSVVRARIDERTKRQAACGTEEGRADGIGRFRLLLVRVAAEKTLPFEPLQPNKVTVAAMRAARRGELVGAGKPGKFCEAEMRDVKYTSRFKRDYRRNGLAGIVKNWT